MPYRNPAAAATAESIAAHLGQRADAMLDTMSGDHKEGDRIAYIVTAVAALTTFGTVQIHDAAEALVKVGALPDGTPPDLARAISAAAARLPA